MEDTSGMEEIVKLRRTVKEKQDMIIKSAEIGKGLLDENTLLNSKIEELSKIHKESIDKLKQENYSLNLKLDTKEKTIQSLESELEQVEIQQNVKTSEVEKSLNKEMSNLLIKIENLEKEKEKLQDDLEESNKNFNEIQVSVKAMQEVEKEPLQAEISIGIDEDSFQNQLEDLRKEKSDALEKNNELALNLQKSKMKVLKLEKWVEELKEESEYNKCELTSLNNVIEKKNIEIQDLQVEIETMKLDQIDPKRRGNSLFAEVEDNRKLIERKYLELKEEFLSLERLYQFKHDQVHKMKLRISSLLATFADTGSLDYQKQLEQTIASLKQEMMKLKDHCQSLENKLLKEELPNEEEQLVANSMEEMYRNLLKETKVALSNKEKEVTKLFTEKVFLNDELIELKKQLNGSKKSNHELNAEVMQLKVRLEQESGIDLDKENVKQLTKTEKRIEVLPFLKNEEKGEKTSNEDDQVFAKNLEKVLVPNDKQTSNSDLMKPQYSGKGNEIIQNKENFDCLKRTQGVRFNIGEEQENTKVNKEKPKKKLRKMDAPHITADDGAQCQQQ